jgi:hypothetical protein
MSIVYTDQQRAEDVFLLTEYDEATITNAPTAQTLKKHIRVPRACTIERIDAYYETEAGTGPALTVQVRSGTTALIQAAVTDAQTMTSGTAAESGQSLDRDFGEVLNLTYGSANADNDFTLLSVQVWATRRG